MNTTQLKATVRPAYTGKFKEVGFVAGVLYGKTIESSAVMFEEDALMNLIAKHGKNTKVSVEFAGVTMNGFVKDLQRSVMSQKISHIDIQIIG